MGVGMIDDAAKAISNLPVGKWINEIGTKTGEIAGKVVGEAKNFVSGARVGEKGLSAGATTAEKAGAKVAKGAEDFSDWVSKKLGRTSVAEPGKVRTLEDTLYHGAHEVGRQGYKLANKGAEAFSKLTPKGKAIVGAGVGIPVIGIATGHGDTVISAPMEAGKAITETVDKGFSIAEGTAEKTGSFISENSKWLLPAAGVAAGALLLGKGGLGSVAKVGLIAGAGFLGYNAIKGVSAPANSAIAEAGAEATSDKNVVEKVSDNMFGEQKIQREEVDTSLLPYDMQTQSDTSLGY